MNVDPFDTEAFLAYYRAAREPAQQPQLHPAPAVARDVGEGSPALVGLRSQQAHRKSAPDNAARPRGPNILEKLRSLSLCRPEGNQVESSLRRKGASSGGGHPGTLVRYTSHRMDAPSPRSLTVQSTAALEEEALNLGTEAEESSQVAAPEKKRRRTHIKPHPDDEAFFNQLLAAYGGHASLKKYAESLRTFSAWLFERGRDGLSIRFNNHGLDLDVQEYVSEGNVKLPLSALKKFRTLLKDGQFAEAAPPKQRSTEAGVEANDTRWGRQPIPDADAQLLNEFRQSSIGNAGTVGVSVAHMRGFSAWLDQNGKPGLAARIHSDYDGLAADASFFNADFHMLAALKHLREATTSRLGVAQIKPLSKEAPVEDENLLNRFYKALLAAGTKKGSAANYESCLRDFCSWLSSSGRPSLAARHGINDEALDADIKEYHRLLPPRRYKVPGTEEVRLDHVKKNNNVKYAIKTLRKLSADFEPLKMGAGYGIPAEDPEDSRLLTRFYNVARGGGGDYSERVLANFGNILHRFSAWLSRNDRSGLAARLFADEVGLDADAEAFANDESILFDVSVAVKHLRRWSEGPGQSFFSNIDFPTGSGLDDPLRDDAAHDGDWPASYADTLSFSDVGFPTGSGLDDPLRGSQGPGQSFFSNIDFPTGSGQDDALRDDAAHEGGWRGSYTETLSSFLDPSSYPGTSATFDPHAAASAAGGYGVAGASLTGGDIPIGLANVDVGTFLNHYNADRGVASGQGLNCLLDTVVQLASTTRREYQGAPQIRQIEHQAREMRDYLINVGVVEPNDDIDAYAPSRYSRQGILADLARAFGLRIQAIEQAEGGVSVHPVFGDQGPLVHILHTPGHFQPLWPRQP